jgi:uncharacterized protein YjeT (DUF2065 family)
MRDFIGAIGLVLAIAGLLMVAFPGALAQAMAQLAHTPPERLRKTGMSAALGGRHHLGGPARPCVRRSVMWGFRRRPSAAAGGGRA